MSWRLELRELRNALKGSSGQVYDALKSAEKLRSDEGFQEYLIEEGTPFEVFFHDMFAAHTGHSFSALHSSLRHFPKRSDWCKLGLGEVLMQAWERDHPPQTRTPINRKEVAARKLSALGPTEKRSVIESQIESLPVGNKLEVIVDLLEELTDEEFEQVVALANEKRRAELNS